MGNRTTITLPFNLDAARAAAKIAAYLGTLSATNYDTESHDGKPWAELSPRYAKWKQKRFGNKPKLIATGKTRSTLRDFVEGGNTAVVEFGRVAPGGGELGLIHQFGAPAANIPARPVLPELSDAVLDKCAEIVVGEVLG